MAQAVVGSIPSDALYFGCGAVPECTLVEQVELLEFVECSAVVSRAVVAAIGVVDATISLQQSLQFGQLASISLLCADDVEVVLEYDFRHSLLALRPRIAICSIRRRIIAHIV